MYRINEVSWPDSVQVKRTGDESTNEVGTIATETKQDGYAQNQGGGGIRYVAKQIITTHIESMIWWDKVNKERMDLQHIESMRWDS